MTGLPVVSGEGSIRDAVAVIDAHGDGIALVVGKTGRLIETLTDGDVRRAMLAGMTLDDPLASLVDRVRKTRSYEGPVTASPGAAVANLVALMKEAAVRQVPLVDDDGRPVDLVLLDELVEPTGSSLRAMVMAGGFGRRLAPLTDETPKPMLPVGDRPLLQRIIEQLRDAGIRHVKITTHYRGEVISRHFGDGRTFGVEIEYVPEEQPLGTAGALGLIDIDGPLLVMNGDLLTGVDVRAMHRFHEEHDAMMTVAVRPYEVSVPFGLVRLDDELITDVEEKPVVRGFANAGVYLLNPEVRSFVPAGERLDMTDLIARLTSQGARVVGFPLRESWLDVGRPADYALANAAVTVEQSPIGESADRRAARPVLAVVVARGGSKGLPGKALRPLAGIPLIVHSIELARRCPEVARVIVSTDSDEIARVARDAGADVPFRRPAQLSTDDAPMWPVLRHALEAIDPTGSAYGSLLLLQASNPTRLPEDVAAAVKLLEDNERADGVIGVSSPRHNPIWTARVLEDGMLCSLIDSGDRYVRRQDVPPVLDINGLIYLWRANVVRSYADDPGAALRALPLEIPARRAIDIDSADDAELAELLVSTGLIRLPWLQD